jgi:RNA polymerase sigma-70 factor (ECF subfamily)
MAMTLAEGFDTDGPVIEAIRDGDRYAFDELVRRHSDWVRGVIFGVLGDQDRVDDVAQQAWSSAWRRIGELRDSNRWRPWLYRVARNAAVDAGRDVTRRRGRTRALVEEAVSASSAPADGELVDKERHRRVLDAIQALPALYREPFVLRHMNDWSYKQIAEVMDMPVDSVETRLVRARRLLRESLKELVE